MKLITTAMLFFVGCLGAQTSQQSESKTTTTTAATNAPVNLDGTLVDQSCYTTHTHTKETNSDPNSTTTTVTTKDSSDCPVTTSTKTFSLRTPDGKMVRFDDASNTRVVQMMKSDKDFNDDMNGHRPVRVRVVAMPNGEVMVIKDIKANNQ
jgi:hypothetical protein